jgi:hypothetical protein
MSSNREILILVSLVFTCLLPATTMAESDLQIGGAVGSQSKQLKYQFAGIRINPTFQTLVYSLTASYGKFFSTAEVETMIQGDTQYVGNVGLATTTIIESKRSDSALTLGYNLWRGLSIFGGYKTGETESNLSPTDGGVLKLNFSQKGPFAGIAYGQSIGSKGTLAVSAAYASLNGDANVVFYGKGAEFVSGGSTSGLSYGLSWTGALSEKGYYRLSYKINKYKFKDKDFGFEGKDLSTDEDYRITGLAVGTSF